MLRSRLSREVFRKLALAASLALPLLGAGTAQAHTLCTSDIGTLGPTPFTCEVTKTNNGLFLDTINFSVANPNTIVTITSSVTGISFFSIPIFENQNDAEFVADDDGTHISVDLSQFASIADPDYHLHPQGLISGGTGTYELTFIATAVPEAGVGMLLLGALALAGRRSLRTR